MPQGQTSTITGFNVYTKLLLILAKVVRSVYPTRHVHENRREKHSRYVVTDTSILGVEADLADWAAKLPLELQPSVDSTPKLQRCVIIIHQCSNAYYDLTRVGFNIYPRWRVHTYEWFSIDPFYTTSLVLERKRI